MYLFCYYAHRTFLLSTTYAEGRLIASLNCQTSFGQVLSNAIYEIIIQMTLVDAVVKSTLTFGKANRN